MFVYLFFLTKHFVTGFTLKWFLFLNWNILFFVMLCHMLFVVTLSDNFFVHDLLIESWISVLHSWLGTTAIWFFILVFLMKQILQNLYEKDFFLWFTSIQVIYKLYSTWIITKLTNEYFLSFMIFTNMTLKWFFIFKFLMLLMSKKRYIFIIFQHFCRWCCWRHWRWKNV